jgi:hypothetical protein
MVWVNRCKTFSVPTVSRGDDYHYLKINYAAKGNCEVKVRDNKFIYVNALCQCPCVYCKRGTFSKLDSENSFVLYNNITVYFLHCLSYWYSDMVALIEKIYRQKPKCLYAVDVVSKW